MNVIIIGDGGHSKVIQEIIFAGGEYRVIAVLDDKYTNPFQFAGMIHGPVGFIFKLLHLQQNVKVVLGIGSNEVRKKLAKHFNLFPERYATVIHPTAVVSPSAKIGQGTVIMPQAVVNARAEIGMHCIINTASIVEHDNTLGDYTHLSPNATLAGNVSVGEGAHIGSGATVIPGKYVGHWSVIGAGSTVIEHIPGYSKAVGNPTKIIEKLLISKI